jgi:hypothetical protein
MLLLGTSGTDIAKTIFEDENRPQPDLMVLHMFRQCRKLHTIYNLWFAKSSSRVLLLNLSTDFFQNIQHSSVQLHHAFDKII